ncbi:MAG: Xaa-Pro aminopeptidase, partial [Actinomycetota bacterium]|nr:Xaa-Pro aminopeptidase [Actinomycetota bacterium]
MDAMADTNAPRPASNRSTVPVSDTFKDYISSKWAERPDVAPAPREQASFAAARRVALSQKYPGKRLIIPAGAAKVRSNDTDYAYRAHSAFAHLTG